MSSQYYIVHIQTRIEPVLGLQVSTPNSELFPNRVPMELSRIAFPTIVLPKDHGTDSVQEDSILDHDLGHLCRGGRVQMSGRSDLGISHNLGASSILIWV